jgi:dephospho-CoA kinase
VSDAPLVVGLTGGMGVGKTTASGLLARRGAEVVDGDGLGRLVVEPGGPAYDGVVAHFGARVLAPDGRIDRPALAGIVFGDPAALGELNAITHPAIDAEIARRIASADAPLVVLDLAVLVESRLGAGQYHQVVVVEAPMELRLARLAARGVPADEARRRIASQATDDQRRAVADHLVTNDGDLETLDRRIDLLWRVLLP